MLTSQELQFYSVEQHKITIWSKNCSNDSDYCGLWWQMMSPKAKDGTSHFPWYSGITFVHTGERKWLQLCFNPFTSTQEN